MAGLSTKGFTDLLRGQVAAIQASASGLVDFTVGSVLRALVESTAQIALWLQGLILALLATTRAATSKGVDLDSWMADYSLTRLSAKSAVGVLTFSRLTTTAAGVIQIGSAAAETSDGAQQFTVTRDTGNSLYDGSLNAYVIPIGVADADVPATANLPGADGNAAPGAINTIIVAMPGIDTVTNASAFAGGSDAETDVSFLARFINFLASLAKATKAAIRFAILSVQAGVSESIDENKNYDGSDHLGHFSVVADDGTGSPDADFLNRVGSAVELVRAICISYEVHGPTVLTADVAMTIDVADGYNKTATVAAVRAAIIAALNAIALGDGFSFTRLYDIAYQVSDGVLNVRATTLNTATSDLAGLPKQAIRAGTVTVTPA